MCRKKEGDEEELFKNLYHRNRSEKRFLRKDSELQKDNLQKNKKKLKECFAPYIEMMATTNIIKWRILNSDWLKMFIVHQIFTIVFGNICLNSLTKTYFYVYYFLDTVSSGVIRLVIYRLGSYYSSSSDSKTFKDSIFFISGMFWTLFTPLWWRSNFFIFGKNEPKISFLSSKGLLKIINSES